MSNNKKVYVWHQVASDIALQKGWSDEALDTLIDSIARDRDAEQDVSKQDKIGLDKYGRDQYLLASEAAINQDVYNAVRCGELTAYYPDGCTMLLEEVNRRSIMLSDVCVHAKEVNQFLKQKGYLDAWHPRTTVEKNTTSGWHDLALQIADELDARDRHAGAHCSIIDMSERVEKEMLARGIRGCRGPVSASTIKRDVLQGGKWQRLR